MENEHKLSYTAAEIEERLGKAGDAVLYTEQTLTDEQKAKARANIGAASESEGGASAGLPVVDLDKYYDNDEIVEDGDAHPCPEAMAEILERCSTQGIPCIFKLSFEDGYVASYLCNCDILSFDGKEFLGVYFIFYVGKLTDSLFMYKYMFIKLFEDDVWQYVVNYGG